jgi:hypothetical protein
MNCRRAARLLCFDAGGDLGPRRSSAVADHLVICTACRSFRDELLDALETARSLEHPSLEHGGEELRRRVWSEIRKDRHRADTRKAAGFGLVAAAAAFSAAVLLSFSLLARRPAADSGQVSPPEVPPAIASAPVPPGPARESAPASPVAPLRASALASRPRVDAGEGGVTRIEFRAPNSQVRIIWLVGQEAPETSPAQPPGPKQEVS